MKKLREIVSRNPLTAFVIVSFALSWWSFPFAGGAILPYGPFLGALIVVALTRPKGGIKEFLRRLVSWRGGWFWLLVGPALVIAYQGLAFLVNLALGAGSTGPSSPQSYVVPILSLILLGGVWEEPGWTGYALPLLQERYADHPRGLLLASLHMGAIRTMWHLPLVISGVVPWYEMIFLNMAFQFLATWIFNRSSGSVLAVMAFHLASNFGGLVVPLFSGSARDQYRLLFILFAWLMALPLASLNRWSMGRPKSSAQAA